MLLVLKASFGPCNSQFCFDEFFGMALTYIHYTLRLSNTKREDITLIGFQIWVFGMSIVALLNESIPHICAALVTQLLVTIWTLFQVTQTEQFRQSFARIITNDACHGMKLLGNYWQERKVAEISSAVLNGVGLLVTALLTYKLTKVRLVKSTYIGYSHLLSTV